MKRLLIFTVGMAGVAALAGCSLPGQAFPGGPSPWLPGGAPGGVYAPPSTTHAAPHPATQDQSAQQVRAR